MGKSLVTHDVTAAFVLVAVLAAQSSSQVVFDSCFASFQGCLSRSSDAGSGVGLNFPSIVLLARKCDSRMPGGRSLEPQLFSLIPSSSSSESSVSFSSSDSRSREDEDDVVSPADARNGDAGGGAPAEVRGRAED